MQEYIRGEEWVHAHSFYLSARITRMNARLDHSDYK